VLFATIPPTFAAALITISGRTFAMNLEVSSRLNKSTFFLLPSNT